MRFYGVLIVSVGALLIAQGASAADPDGDGLPNRRDNCNETYNPDQLDIDHDDVGDVCDNCTIVANHGQEDANDDGFGNRCDGDLDDDLVVGMPDFGIFTQ